MAKKKHQKEPFIKCKVSQGMFSSEWGITVELSDGRNVSAFIDKKQILLKEEPGQGQEVEGSVRVSIVEPKKNTIVVDLPQPALTKGPRIEVARRLFEEKDL